LLANADCTPFGRSTQHTLLEALVRGSAVCFGLQVAGAIYLQARQEEVSLYLLLLADLITTTTTTKDNNGYKPIDCGLPMGDCMKGVCYKHRSMIVGRHCDDFFYED
jgi:hypothetical protein